MAWGYVAIAAAGAYSAYSSGKASDAQNAAANLSIEEKRRQYALTRKDSALYRMSGEAAQVALNDMIGLDTINIYDSTVEELQAKLDDYNVRALDRFNYEPKINRSSRIAQNKRERAGIVTPEKVLERDFELEGDLSTAKQRQSAFESREKHDFRGSPGYQFRLSEGQKGLERSQAGRRLGGRATKEALRYSQGFATREFNAQYDRLSSVANRGISAVGITAGTAPNFSNEYQQIGNAEANRQSGRNAAVQGAVGNAFSWYAYNNPKAPAT